MKTGKIVLEMMLIVILIIALITPQSAFKIQKRDVLEIEQQYEHDETPPMIIINFAGNPADKGGPYWQPPGESICLMNHTIEDWREGYYTNDSRQQEDWIYINATIADDSVVNEVWLHWYDATTHVWTNYSYPFIQTSEDFWEINTSDIITDIVPGRDYSFDVFAVDESNNSNLLRWEKTGLNGEYTRRYIQLGCMPEEVLYRPFYLREYTSETGIYTSPPRFQHDRLHHDQGPADTETDTGYLNSTEPEEDIEIRYCTTVVAYWFEDNTCPFPFNLTNIYFHYWYITPNDGLRCTAAAVSRKAPGGDIIGSYQPPDKSGSHSHVATDYGMSYLDTNLLPTNSSYFTDNNLYELCVFINHVACGPPIRVLSNQSFMSFVLLNVPDNLTLSTMDSDADDISDYTELYYSYTSPFHRDTDNDGASDWEELNAQQFGYENSDPNNYTDTTVYRKDLTVYAGGPYFGEVNESIEFSGFAVGGQPPYTYYWDFGDGNISKGQNASHIYGHLGVYTVNLTVVDSEQNMSYEVTTASIQSPVVWVDDDFDEDTPGWNLTHFRTIQNGVDNVLSGGHVFVDDGIYHEHILINKPLTLQGSNINSTIIDGNDSGIALTISADNVRATGFTIQSSEYSLSTYTYHAIVIDSDHTTIIRNIITNSKFGIFLKIGSTNNCIQWNTISNNKRSISLRGSSENIIFGNRILDCYDYGIFLIEETENNNIYDNNIINNNYGIYIKKNPGNPNEPSVNPVNNTIYHNNFIDNTQNACDQSDNIWHRESIQQGNYWDDFEQNPGYPEFYEIPCGDNIDLYPLTDPWVTIIGDIDHDGDVDLIDLVGLLVNYGMVDEASYEDGDLDGDGDVDLADLAELLSHYGEVI